MWEARDLFAEYAAVAQNAESFYEQLAPFFRERLGDAFDARAWFAHLIERGKEFLTLAQAVGQTHKGVQRVAYEDEEATGYTLVYDRATKAELRQILQERFPHLTIASCREAIVQQGASDLANTFGAENTRVILGTIPDATAAAIQRYMTPEIPGVVVEDLRRLYDDIHFETYALNERVVAEEIAWLKDVLLKEQPVLDAGCGTGRLLVPLAQAGYDIRGVDLVSRHVAETKAQLIATGSATTETASERVREGSWTDLPHESNTFGSVVMLGRNILHEVGIDGQTRLFAEVARVLQDGGTFVFDIPAATIPGSYYKTMVDGYVEAMRARGITNTRRGTIVDSPDGEHFATRYVYHHEDILALAAGAGFAVVAVEEKDLPTGKGDKNRYYRLQKQAADNSRSAIRPIQPLVHERAA
jgi:SAM-dependent methyltransferase